MARVIRGPYCAYCWTSQTIVTCAKISTHVSPSQRIAPPIVSSVVLGAGIGTPGKPWAYWGRFGPWENEHWSGPPRSGLCLCGWHLSWRLHGESSALTKQLSGILSASSRMHLYRSDTSSCWQNHPNCNGCRNHGLCHSYGNEWFYRDCLGRHLAQYATCWLLSLLGLVCHRAWRSLDCSWWWSLR